MIVLQADRQVRRFLRMSLPHHGYRVEEAATAAEGLRAAEKRRPDILILDLGSSDDEELDVIRRVRAWSHVPIIVLSARGEESDKVAALDAGADDYVSKPFGFGELLARMRAALRRAARRGGGARDPAVLFAVGDLEADLIHRRVTLAGNEVNLTPVEYRLFAALIRNAGKIVPQRQLLTEVWGPARLNRSHSLRVYMAQLRGKLETDPTRPKHLLTEHGVGYGLAVENGDHLARVRSIPTRPHR